MQLRSSDNFSMCDIIIIIIIHIRIITFIDEAVEDDAQKDGADDLIVLHGRGYSEHNSPGLQTGSPDFASAHTLSLSDSESNFI